MPTDTESRRTVLDADALDLVDEEAAPAAPGTGAAPRSTRTVTVAILTLVTLVAFEAMAVAATMPTAARALDAVGGYGLAVSAFLATSLLGTVVSGFWNDRAGPKVPMLIGLVAFVGGLLLSGVAQSFPAFVAGRAVGGIGAGLISVSIYVLIGHAYTAAQRPKLFGWFSAAWVLPALIGPFVAGVLTAAVSWRLIFLAVPPIAVPAALALYPVLKRVTPTRSGGPATGHAGRRIAAGAAIAVAAAAVQIGAERLGTGVGVATAAAGLVVLVGALAILLPAGTARLRRGIPALVATRGMLTTAFFGADAFLPLMLVTQRGLSPAVAGLALTAGAVGWSAGSWIQARVRTDVMHARLLAAGSLTVGVGAVLLGIVALGLPSWLVAVVWVFSGTGMGAAMSSGSVLLLNLSAPAEQGTNSSYIQLADSLGGVVGVGVGGAIFAAAHAAGPVHPVVFTTIWLVLAASGIAAGLAGRRAALRPRSE